MNKPPMAQSEYHKEHEADMADNLGKYLSVNTPELIAQVFDNPGTAIMKIPFRTLLIILGQVAQRAIELDDPELNALMIKLNLYEIPPEERSKHIDAQYARIKEKIKENE